MLWRRGYRVRPPLGEPDDDPRYATLPPNARPRGESLHDVTVRLLPYWCDAIVPDLCRSGLLAEGTGHTDRPGRRPRGSPGRSGAVTSWL